jgi:hypothetical protein
MAAKVIILTGILRQGGKKRIREGITEQGLKDKGLFLYWGSTLYK